MAAETVVHGTISSILRVVRLRARPNDAIFMRPNTVPAYLYTQAGGTVVTESKFRKGSAFERPRINFKRHSYLYVACVYLFKIGARLHEGRL